MHAVPPVIIQSDGQIGIRLVDDPQAGSGHKHPLVLTQDQVALVLKGLRVLKRQDSVVSLFKTDANAVPVFTEDEMKRLTPGLVQAFAHATPQQLVTFSLHAPAAAQQRAVTSGGLFIHDGHLFVILANHRTAPSISSEGATTESPGIEDPLLSIRPRGFALGFMPVEMQVPLTYVLMEENRRLDDEAKVVVLDVQRVLARSSIPPIPAMPAILGGPSLP